MLIIGQRYHFLTCIGRAKNKRDKWHWLMRCDCGTEKVLEAYKVGIGHNKSCGCKRSQLMREAKIKHGASICEGTLAGKTYKAWSSMRQRCGNKSNHAYADYGGRGIAVCPEWLNSFPRFLEDMGIKPDGMSLDRIDNNKGYSPSNCRWATHTEQMRNRRNNRPLTIGGETKLLCEWEAETGISHATIQNRIKRGRHPLLPV